MKTKLMIQKLDKIQYINNSDFFEAIKIRNSFVLFLKYTGEGNKPSFLETILCE